jgi:Bacterial Ig-like domain (group 3)
MTATVTASDPGTGTPTGTVAFTEGSTIVASGTLSAGTLTVTTSSLGVGRHGMTATYSGDTSFLGSTSNVRHHWVQQGTTTTTVTANANPSVAGKYVTFTATVAINGSAAGTPTGSVTFNDGATALGTASVANGAASWITSSIGAGSHAITATYSGDGNFVTSSGSLAQAVVAGNPGIDIGFTTGLGSVITGHTVTVRGWGLEPNSVVTATLHSTPHVIATFATDGTGAFFGDVMLPSSIESGGHQLILTGTGFDGRLFNNEVSFSVSPAGVLTTLGAASMPPNAATTSDGALGTFMKTTGLLVLAIIGLLFILAIAPTRLWRKWAIAAAPFPRS